MRFGGHATVGAKLSCWFPSALNLSCNLGVLVAVVGSVSIGLTFSIALCIGQEGRKRGSSAVGGAGTDEKS